MDRWKRIVAALVWLTVGPATGVRAQEAESFVPFEAHAYRLVNSVDFAPDDEVMYCALFHREVLEDLGLPTDGAPETALFSARRTSEGWSIPELLPFSGSYVDYEPTLSADGSLMVFNSKRPYPDGRVPETNDLWMVEREGEEWGEPARIEALTSFDHEESYGSLTADRSLVFLRAQPGPDDEPAYDLYWSRFVDGAFSEPERHPVSTERWGEGDPWIAPDGSYLLFTRWDDEAGWERTVDLHIAFKQGETWTEAAPLQELNTDGADYAPAVSADGKWLYYRADSQFLRAAIEPILRRHRPE